MTREEAIHIVKTTNDWSELREALQELVPELAESEDERIRKEMIHFLEIEKNQMTPEQCSACENRWIAWLEKQGEQKPVEWSEDDEFHLKSIESTIEYCKREVAENEEARYLFNEDLNWLESLKNRCLPQPKQEWSEEDEKNRDLLIKQLSALKCSFALDFKDAINWLKSLRPHKNDYHEGFKAGFEKAKQMHYNCWKPTEEQMDALKEAFNKGSITFHDMEVLSGLWETLKAL